MVACAAGPPLRCLPLDGGSVKIRRCPAHLFNHTPLLLALDPTLLRRFGGFGFFPGFGLLRGLPDQLHKPLDRVLAVPFLRAELPGLDDEDAVLGDAPACQADETRAHITGQRRRIPHIEPELNGRGHFVHVLSAGAGGTDEVELYFTIAD